MKRIVFFLLALVIGAAAMLSACAQTEPNEPDEPAAQATPVSVEISGMRTDFAYGEAFSSEGLVVTLQYSDGSDRVLQSSEYTCDASAYRADASGGGTYTIVVRYNETVNGAVLSAEYDVTVAPAPAWDADGALKILAIGNSFSDDTMDYVWQIADSLGVGEVCVGTMYIGGSSLDGHAQNAANDAAAYYYRVNTGGNWVTTMQYKMSDALSSQNWDFVCLQQQSGNSGVESSYTALSALTEYVRTHLPADAYTQIVWNMTWAYQSDSTNGDFGKYDNDQTIMYESIVSAVQARVVPLSDIAAVVPCGTAIQNARTSFIGDHLTRDGYHLDYDIGRYIAGLTLVGKLTGLPLSGAYAPDGVDPDQKKVAIESADNAINTPFAVTNSAYPVRPEFDGTGYEKVALRFEQGYYDSTLETDFMTVLQSGDESGAVFATQIFTREQLPVGSVILCGEGWRYRSERWTDNVQQHGRESYTDVYYTEITEAWWGNRIYAAFNVSPTDGTAAESVPDGAFAVYVPSAEEETELAAGLDAPANLAYADRTITFGEVDGASYYRVQIRKNNILIADERVTENTYRVRDDLYGECAVTVTAGNGESVSSPAQLTADILALDHDVLLEAEDAVLNPANALPESAAHGGAYALNFNDRGQGMCFRYYAYEGGERTIDIAYATASPGSFLNLFVNDSPSQEVIFTENTGWFGDGRTTAIVSVTAELEQGWNELYLMKAGLSNATPIYGGYAQVDYIVIHGSGNEYDPTLFDFNTYTYKLEAESAAWHWQNTSRRPTRWPGTFSKDFGVGEMNADGDGVEFTFTVAESGMYRLQLAYGGSGATTVNVIINGGEAQAHQLTGSTAWNDVTLDETGIVLEIEAGDTVTIDFQRAGKWYVPDYLLVTKVTE